MNSNAFSKKPLAMAIGAALAGTSPLAAAQTDGADDGLMEEIMVTATRRETTVQDIPYNISAISGDSLERQNVVNQYDVLRAMHGITAVDRGYRNMGTVNSIVIRGLNVDNGMNGDIMLNAVPTVATYYDNTPMFANFLVKDVERVEVLRGPQGTLYGSGSLGGTLRYIGRRPDASGFDASMSVDYSQTSGSDGDNVAFDGMVNIPLSDNTAIRALYSRIDNDGVIDYVNAYQLSANGEPLINVNGTCTDPRSASDVQVLQNVACFEEVSDADTVEIDFAKVSLRSEVSDTFSVQVSYQMQEDKIGARRARTIGDNNQPSSSSLFFQYGSDDSGQVLLEPSERDVSLASLDLDWDLGFATFTSSTSSYDHEGVGESDNGGLWASGGEADPALSRDWNSNYYGGGWPRPMQLAQRGYDDSAFIQEFRLVSNESESPVDWIVGAFYMDQENSVWQLSYNPGMNAFHNACVDTGGPECAGFWPAIFYPGDQLTEIDFEYRRDTKFEEMAVYGELTWNVSDAFRLTGGFRWFDNETTNDVVLGFPLVVGWTSPMAPRSTQADDDVLVKLNASWDLSDTHMVYGTYSEGYRHGGAQAVPSLANGDPFGEPNGEGIRTFQSDSVQNYEIGIKGSLEAMRYSASLFRVDWDNPQLNTTSAWYGFYLAANGDKASTQGIELELEGYLGDSFRYRLGYTNVDAKLEADFFSPQTGSLVAPNGSKLPGAPENVFTLSVDNTWEFANGMSLVGAFSMYYQSETENYIDQRPNNFKRINRKFDAHTLLNANLSLSRDNWVVTLYGRNLGDEAAITGGFASSYWSYDTGVFENWYGNGNREFLAQPQTIGLRLGYSF